VIQQFTVGRTPQDFVMVLKDFDLPQPTPEDEPTQKSAQAATVPSLYELCLSFVRRSICMGMDAEKKGEQVLATWNKLPTQVAEDIAFKAIGSVHTLKMRDNRKTGTWPQTTDVSDAWVLTFHPLWLE